MGKRKETIKRYVSSKKQPYDTVRVQDWWKSLLISNSRPHLCETNETGTIRQETVILNVSV